MYINHVGRMVSILAQGTDLDEIYYKNLNVSLLSAMSCTGRIVVGLASDLLLRFYGIRRRTLLAVTALLMTLGHMCVLLIPSLQSLWICTAVIGFAYGGMFSISPTIISDRFGTPNFGINWGWACFATAIGGQSFSLIFGAIVDGNEEAHECYDASCYHNAFLITCVTVAASFFVAVYFGMRRREEERGRGFQPSSAAH